MKTILSLVGLVVVARFVWFLVAKMNPEVFNGQPFQVGYWVGCIVLGILLLGRD